MPENTDKLFVTDRNKVLVGELTLTCILLNDVQRKVSEVMEDDPLTFSPEDIAEHAARTLNVTTVSAAVVDSSGKLMGRLTIDEIVDVVYEETDTDLRRMGGLSAGEDVFAPSRKR